MGRGRAEDDLLSRQAILFIGKGGVGKTTAAAATALLLLDSVPANSNILLFSTDPAHSIFNSLGLEAKRGPTLVRSKGTRRLYAYEEDTHEAMAAFKERYSKPIAELLDRGTVLNRDEIRQFLSLDLPGADEMAALFSLMEFLESGRYKHIVVDTAPTGHTERLLEMPEVFSEWLQSLDALEDKHRFIADRLGGLRTGDAVENFLAEFRARLGEVKAALHDAARTALVLVAAPQEMVLMESIRYLGFLKSRGLMPNSVLVNRVDRPRKGCRFCSSRARMQTEVLVRHWDEFGEVRVRLAPLLAREVKGIRALSEFARLAWIESESGRRPEAPPAGRRAPESRRALRYSAGGTAASGQSDSSGFSIEDRRLLFFGGKGGVGKTTAACAAAIAYADRGFETAIISTDPAHSLSDCLGERIGERKQGVARIPTLTAVEINASAKFEEFKARAERWVSALFELPNSESNWRVEFDREAMTGFVNAAPPGMDEAFSLVELADWLAEGRPRRTLVVDTAPSGHFLRLLELPEIALSWVKVLLRVALHNQQVADVSELARELVSLSKTIKSTLSLLKKQGFSEFIGVALPETICLEETEAMYTRLDSLGIPSKRLLINGVMSRVTRCRVCASRGVEHRKAVAAFRERLYSRQILVAAEVPYEIRGPELLRLHFGGWVKLG